MKTSVKNMSGESVTSIQLSDFVFSASMNTDLVQQALVMYQSNLRQGTHNTKTRAEVSGGGRKPWRQKYMNKARQGSNRAPHWRHGGVTFGPKPKDYRKSMLKKMRRAALRCMLSSKLRENKLVVIDGIDLETPKAKPLHDILHTLGIEKSALIVCEKPTLNLVRAAGNFSGIRTLPADLMNAHELLRKDYLLMTTDAIQRAEIIWGNNTAIVESSKEIQSAT